MATSISSMILSALWATLALTTQHGVIVQGISFLFAVTFAIRASSDWKLFWRERQWISDGNQS